VLSPAQTSPNHYSSTTALAMAVDADVGVNLLRFCHSRVMHVQKTATPAPQPAHSINVGDEHVGEIDV
jgi:hypothetical protein